MEWYSAIF